MFEPITPEEAGISSKKVQEFISYLERRGFAMHSVLLMKGEKLFGEYYWKPFDRDFCHRMYSETKSYVGVAIGLLEEEGKVNLDNSVISYFPEKADGELPEYFDNITVRDMLRMQTGTSAGNWFTNDDPDRTHLYFNRGKQKWVSGAHWEYDSAGSQVLSSLVEKLSGMSLLDYLKKKIFNEIGTFKTAEVLKTRNGDSWGDSALICTPRDMISFARFVMNYGTWNGKRLMNEQYLRTATSPLSYNDTVGFEAANAQGYGYQIWCTEQGGFAFNGMGSQYTVCLPSKDIIFVCTADNQGRAGATDMIWSAFFDYIANNMQDSPLPEDKEAYAELQKATENLKLKHVKGNPTSAYLEKINGKNFICQDNAQGIVNFSLRFDKEKGEFRYTNAQGEKVLPFGIGKNHFGKFPQYGYSNDFGGMRTTDGFLYNCATSGAWKSDFQFVLVSQIIDRYFGNCCMVFSFKDNTATVSMVSNAEDFLSEYRGIILAEMQ